MVHVFCEATKSFVQVHHKKIPQRPSSDVARRSKHTEYMKTLLALEKAHPVKCIYNEKKE